MESAERLAHAVMLNMPVFFWIVAAGSTAVLAVNYVLERYVLRGRKPIERTLYLRDLTLPPGLLMTAEAKSGANVFTAEFNVLFEFIVTAVDYAVMKYVGDNVRILSQQEAKHAVLHLNANKRSKSQGENASRWRWFLWLADFLLLRCRRALGACLALHIEASSWAWFYLPLRLPFVKHSLPNLFVFHGLEEIEHGALTVQHLRGRTSLLLSLVTFPLAIVLHVLFLLCPPIVVLCMRPGLLLQPSAYVDLGRYYLAFGVAFVASTYGQIAYCLLPLRESQTLYARMHATFERALKERGISYRVLDQATYELA